MQREIYAFLFYSNNKKKTNKHTEEHRSIANLQLVLSIYALSLCVPFFWCGFAFRFYTYRFIVYVHVCVFAHIAPNSLQLFAKVYVLSIFTYLSLPHLSLSHSLCVSIFISLSLYLALSDQLYWQTIWRNISAEHLHPWAVPLNANQLQQKHNN